jgi:hypothetical protein
LTADSYGAAGRRDGGAAAEEDFVVKTAFRRSFARAGVTAIAAVAVAAILSGFGVAAATAGTYGNAPWCAVRNLGSGNIEWDCEYRTVEECAPTVVAGNRGFCNLNPYYPGTYSASPRGVPWRAAHHRSRHRSHRAPRARR